MGGPWLYYTEFRATHGLEALPKPAIPEIAIKAGSLLTVPVEIVHDPVSPLEISLKVNVPDGWKVTSGQGRLLLPAERQTALLVEIQTPELSAEALKSATPQNVVVELNVGDQRIGLVQLNVLLGRSGLPQ